MSQEGGIALLQTHIIDEDETCRSQVVLVDLEIQTAQNRLDCVYNGDSDRTHDFGLVLDSLRVQIPHFYFQVFNKSVGANYSGFSFIIAIHVVPDFVFG